MTTTWVLEQNVFAEDCFDQMVNHFKEKNIPYHIVKVIPFIHEIEGDVPDVNSPCVVYGSIGTQKLAVKHNWTPGVWTNDGFNESVVTWLLGDLALNYSRSSRTLFLKISQVQDAIERMNECQKQIENETGDTIPPRQMFIKPNSDTKEFAGTVMDVNDFSVWYQNMLDIGYLENNDFEVMISEPRKLGMEWRLVLVDGKVCECSIYKQYQIVKSERQMNPEVIEFAEKCAKIHNPADVFVMDVAQTEDGLKVIEYNTFNSAGLYACDVSNVIDTVNDFIKNTIDI